MSTHIFTFMNKAENSPIKKANICFIGAVAAISGLLFGFDTGIISGSQEFLLHTFKIQNNTLHDNFLHGFMVASVPIGALVGAIVSSICAKNFGRKQSILLTAVLFLIGTLIAAFAMNLNMVIAGRLLMGFAIGLSAMIAQMYLGEISPTEVRSIIILSFQLAITIGLFSAFGINLWFSNIMTGPTANWRWMFAVATIPSLLLFFGILRMPNSPRHLVLKYRIDEAKKSLIQILSRKDISHHKNEGTWAALLKSPYLSLVLIAFGLLVSQQLSDINAVMYYGHEVFKNAGFDLDDASGSHKITDKKYFLKSHFKEKPVFPASIMIEAVGQLTVLFLLTSKWLKFPRPIDNKRIIFAACEDSNCHLRCRPGDVVDFSTSVKKVKTPFIKFQDCMVSKEGNKCSRQEEFSLAFAIKAVNPKRVLSI